MLLAHGTQRVQLAAGIRQLVPNVSGEVGHRRPTRVPVLQNEEMCKSEHCHAPTCSLAAFSVCFFFLIATFL